MNAIRAVRVTATVVMLLAALDFADAGAGVQRVRAFSGDEGRAMYIEHPDWLLPAWTSGGPAAWTVVGPPSSASVTLIGADGSFAPRNHGPSINVWLFDIDAGRLLVPNEKTSRFSLDEGSLPVVTAVADLEDVHVVTTFFTSWPQADLGSWFAMPSTGSERAVTFIRIQASTAVGPRHLTALLAVRPFGLEPDVHAIGSATCDAATSTIVVDGSLFLTGLQPAEACGVSSFARGDVAPFALRNDVPPSAAIIDVEQRAEAMLRLAITPASDTAPRIEFRAPLVGRPPGADTRATLTGGTFDDERSKVANAWRPVLGRVTLETSDQQVNAAFRASQAYLLLNRHADLPRSGPLAHDAFWVRDAAYIGEALERVGASGHNQATIEAVLASQRKDGSFPAITDSAGPRSAAELDAPGQAIVSAVSHYRFTRDRGWLERAYPRLLHATEFLDSLRGRTLADELETRGLIPPNVSAEDLGPADLHHYWDDLWAIAGYREAGFAATAIGRVEDAARLTGRAEDLQTALLRSIDLVTARTGTAVVPNGPEDVLTSAMARGTTPALWPFRALIGGGVDALLRRSFSSYDADWLVPQGGGYRHFHDTLWPYGGLGIAHAMLRLGMVAPAQKVLAWTLAHQTLPGTYAWGEAVNPQHGGLELGDMPHSWAAAELISLLRDMVLGEEEGWLMVNAGAPDGWFGPGRQVALRGAPTHYGMASVVFTRADAADGGESPDLRVVLEGNPPEGWRVRLPGSPASAVADDGEAVAVGPVLTLPPGPHRIVVRYS